MSGILKHKKLCIIVAIIVVLEVFVLFWVKKISLAAGLLVLEFLFLVLFFWDYKVHRIMCSQMKPFKAGNKIRNVDCIIIGELCKPEAVMPENAKTFVQIKDPGISENGSFEILRRTHSILKDQGTVIIALEKKNLEKQSIGISDTYFLHDITIKEYGIENKARLKKLLFFIHPIRSTQILLGSSKIGFYESGGGTVIRDFCIQRDLDFYLFVK